MLSKTALAHLGLTVLPASVGLLASLHYTPSVPLPAVGLTALGLGVASAGTIYLSGLRERAALREKNLSERLAATQKLAALGELAAGIAHELGNPIAIVKQEASLLGTLLEQNRCDEKTVAEIRESAAAVAEASSRATDVLRRLLDFARPRNMVLQDVDVDLACADMAALVAPEARRRGVAFTYRKSPVPLYARTDAPRIKQILLNLLVNALDAVAGREQPAVEMTCVMADTGVDVAVTDNGPGIDREQAAKLFTPFFTTKPEGKGTGLGLAVSQSIATQLGGAITLHSRPGHGARFTLHVPFTPEKL